MDELGQAERRADDVEEPGHDREDRDDRRRPGPPPNSPPIAMPMPAIASAYRPSTRRAEHRRRDVAPGDGGADRDAEHRERTMNTTIADQDPTPAGQRPSAPAPAAWRAGTRAGRTSRRTPSRPTSVAAARPARIRPNSTNRSWRKPPTVPMSIAREDRSRGAARIGRLAELLDERLGRSRRSPARRGRGRGPTPAPSAGSGRRSGRPARGGRRGPRQARRRDGARRADVAAGERLDADDEQDDREHARPARPTAQSNTPASGMWFAVQPNQVRLASGARAGIAAW